jgi:YD repeat-containing protein
MRRLTIVVLASQLAGCGESAPSHPISDLSLSISTAEYNATHRWLVVGQTGSAHVEATSNDCLFDPPCTVQVDIEVTSSAPAVLTPSARTVGSPGHLLLQAEAPGTATVTARADNLAQAKPVIVVAAPLPLDELRVRVERGWSDLTAEYDASGNLLAVTVPAGESGALQVDVIRDGESVFGIPIEVGSSAPANGEPTTGCRPVDLDPACEVPGPAWITGRSPGDAEITVTVRNLFRTFTVHVVAPS